MLVLTVLQAFILSSLDYCNSLLNKNHIRRDHLVLARGINVHHHFVMFILLDPSNVNSRLFYSI